MHEFSIMQNLFTLIEQQATANHLKKITKVTIQVGQLRQMVPEFLQFAWQTITKGTLAEGSQLDVITIPITIYCPQCQKKFPVNEHSYVCPNCANVRIEIVTGKEIILTNIVGDQ